VLRPKHQQNQMLKRYHPCQAGSGRHISEGGSERKARS
jgi:hypothetical protein